MNWQNSVATLVAWATSSLEFAVNFSLQSTLLIVAGLALGALFRKRGSANQSLVYRTTLAAVLLCPLVTWGLSMAGFSGWSVAVPEGYRFAELESVSTESQLAEPIAEKELANEALAAEVGHRTHSAEVSALANLPAFADSTLATGSTQHTHEPNFTPTPQASEPATEAAPSAFALTWVGVLALCFALAWCFVSLWLLARLATAWHRLMRLWRHASPAERVIQVRCRKLATLLRVPAPTVLCTPLLLSPCLAGLRRPAILLPESDVNLTMDGVLVHEVLIHELAHLSRRDHHWNLLRQLATAVFFYQPLLWYLSRQIEATAEEVCDDFVVQHGADRSEYAHRLLDLAEQGTAPFVTVGVGIVSLRSMLARRVLRITDTSRNLSTRVSNLLLVLVLVGGLAGTAVVGLVGLGPQETLAEGEGAKASEPATKGSGNSDKDLLISGKISLHDGTPAVGAHVAVIAFRIQAIEHEGSTEVLTEGTTDQNGNYRTKIKNASSRTHLYATLIARVDGMAIRWRQINLDTDEINASLELPEEELITGMLVDAEGKPLVGAQFHVQGLETRTDKPSVQDWVSFGGAKKIPNAWIPSIATDDQGRFTLTGVTRGQLTILDVAESGDYPSQAVILNTGAVLEIGDSRPSYYPKVNVTPGEEVVLPLVKGLVVEGVVSYEDSGEPVPRARVTINSKQPDGGWHFVTGTADVHGEYRIVARRGSRVGFEAYPPPGTPYLARTSPDSEAVPVEQEVLNTRINISLHRGVMVRGKLIEEGSKSPVSGASIYYFPESDNNPYHVAGTTSGRQVSAADGSFQIGVPPGPGRLVVKDLAGRFALQELSSRELKSGRSGGDRYYAHAVQEIDPPPQSEPLEATIELKRGATIRGQVVDAQGEPIEEMFMVSRWRTSLFLDDLSWAPYAPPILGNRFELSGIEPGKSYPVHFLSAPRRLGATEMLEADEPNPTIVLQPCGEAVVRFVDEHGQPVADYEPTVEFVAAPAGPFEDYRLARRLGALSADADFIFNVDQTNDSQQLKSDEQGKSHLVALIPGATYRIRVSKNLRQLTAKTFVARAGETIDLGTIDVTSDERPEPVRRKVSIDGDANAANKDEGRDASEADGNQADIATTYECQLVDAVTKELVVGATLTVQSYFT